MKHIQISNSNQQIQTFKTSFTLTLPSPTSSFETPLSQPSHESIQESNKGSISPNSMHGFHHVSTML